VERYQYEGILPHARSASESPGADPARVVRIDVVRRMADLLNQAIVHRNSDTPEHAAGSLEACKPCLAELEAAVAACRAAFDEVNAACQPPPEPIARETMANPDRVPTEDHPKFNLPAEGEAGQEALTEDSQYGNPEEVTDRTDPPPEDDPPLGRKGRRR
jgi:hypothetical protein